MYSPAFPASGTRRDHAAGRFSRVRKIERTLGGTQGRRLRRYGLFLYLDVQLVFIALSTEHDSCDMVLIACFSLKQKRASLIRRSVGLGLHKQGVCICMDRWRWRSSLSCSTIGFLSHCPLSGAALRCGYTSSN
jgi:hypothetical protein